MPPNIVFCTDIEIPFIYGTFFEVIYKLKSESKNVIPCLIVGDRQVPRLNKISKFIKEKLGIEKNSIYTYGGLESLSKKKIDKINDFSESVLNNVYDIESLQKIHYNGINIGIPVASSLIMKKLCSEPSIEDNQSLIKNYIKYSAFNCEASTMFLKNKPYDHCYVYNGRTYNTYPLTCVIDENKIFYYERNGKNKELLRIQRGRIHDNLHNSELALDFWKTSQGHYKKNTAKRYFIQNKKNIFTDNFSQKCALNTSKKIISYFTSSDDEISSLHPSIITSKLFPNQKNAVDAIITWVSIQTKYIFVIRVHPHLEKKCTFDRNYWNNLSGKNVFIIPSFSSIDSYHLLNISDKVISYGSTIGIEATFYGKPSISLKYNNYSNHDAVYEPDSYEQLIDFLEQPLEPKNKKNCFPLAYFRMKYGAKFLFLNSLNISSFDQIESLLEI